MVMPWTPVSRSASVTSSSLCGLMMATIALTDSSVRGAPQRRGEGGGGWGGGGGGGRGRPGGGPGGEPVLLTGVLGGCSDRRCGVCRHQPRLFFGLEVGDGEVVVLEAGVGLGDLDEVRVTHLAELTGIGALELDFGRDAHLHEALGEREDDPRHAPGPEEADDDVDHLGAELADVAVEEALHGTGNTVPSAYGIGAVGEEPEG